MNGNIKLNGIVLSSMPVGEYDKRIVILTKEIGKISAFSRSARRPNSSLCGISNPFVYGEFEAYRGTSSYTINKANASNYFSGITSNLDKMFLGTYFLEIADYYAQENANEKERLLLLYRTLQVLENDKINQDLIKAIYELRTMVVNGIYPNVFECMSCKSKNKLISFDKNCEGLICEDCRNKLLESYNSQVVEMNNSKEIINDKYLKSTIYALQYVASSDISKLYSFELKPKVEKEFIHIVDMLKRKYFNHEFKSEQFLYL